jgi:glycosyltransferase involved in cell wall biosynthesis
MLAEECNPDWPSLPVVGYKFAKAIAEYADITLVTQIRNRENIERDGCGNAKVVYIDTEEFAAPLYRFIKMIRGKADQGWTFNTGLMYFHSLYYEWKVWRQFRSQLKSGEFDIVHRLTPMSPTHPSVMATRSPVPFVLGPLNGGLKWPKQFQSELRREREWLSYLRNAYKFLPYVRSTYKEAKAILAAFEHTIADLPESMHSKIVNFPEVGIDPDLFSSIDREQKEQMTILYVGRLVPYKLPEVVVRTFAASPQLRKHRLVVIGEGPERDRLESIIAEYNLSDCVTLLGRKSQAEVGQWMRKADIFAFPSIRELGAGVVIEAMACGMAPVVVDYGGPADLVQPGCGVKVPLGTLDEIVDRFTVELETLVNDSAQVSAYGRAAYSHAMTYYSWQAKAHQVHELYKQILGDRQFEPTSLNLPIPADSRLPVPAGKA